MEVKIAKLLPLPIILISFFLSLSIKNYIDNGEFFIRDLDLKGGTSISFISKNEITIDDVSSILGDYGKLALISISKSEKEYSVRITLPGNVQHDKIIEIIKNSNIETKDFSIQYVGPELGEAFFSQVIYLLSIAYVLIFFANYFIYRKIAIALTIILSSLADIIYVFGVTILLGIPITFAGFTSLLLVIAYTIDTNILLSTKILSEKIEEFYSTYKKTLITGITVTAGLVVSMIIVLVFSNSKLLNNIATILLIGQLADLINTYILNAGLIEVILVGKKR